MRKGKGGKPFLLVIEDFLSHIDISSGNLENTSGEIPFTHTASSYFEVLP
jgi:hypothetical protein